MQSHYRILGRVLTLVALVALTFNFGGASAKVEPDSRYFPETNHTVTQPFLDYWNTHGTLAQQGYPITDDYQEVNDADGKTYRTQYFQRSRFEHHPEQIDPQYKVLLGLLGSEAFLAKYPASLPTGTQTQVVPGGGSRTFPETNHAVTGLFLSYWLAHGGLAQQGYPITEAYIETNDADGKQYVTQYFERARFEYHPEQSDPQYKVLLGLVGNEILLRKGHQTAPTATPQPNAPTPTHTNTATATSTSTATPAPPQAAVTQVVQLVNVAPGAVSGATAACPAGSIVTGGGWLVNSSGSLDVQYSLKFGNGWRVLARNTAGTAKPLKTYAMCLSGTSGITTQQFAKTTILAGTQNGTAQQCTSGVVTGGGFSKYLGTTLYNTSPTSPTGNGWKGAAFNPTGDNLDFFVYSICLSGVNGATSTSVLNQVSSPAGSTTASTVACPAGRLATSGGFNAAPGMLLHIMWQFGNGWQVIGKNNTGAPILLTAYAQCTLIP